MLYFIAIVQVLTIVYIIISNKLKSKRYIDFESKFCKKILSILATSETLHKLQQTHLNSIKNELLEQAISIDTNTNNLIIMLSEQVNSLKKQLENKTSEIANPKQKRAIKKKAMKKII